MAAIIRVKRKLCIKPQDALLLASKRLKTDEDEASESTPLTTVANYAGTITYKDQDDFVKYVKTNLNKKELQNSFKKHNVDISAKMRESMKQRSAENRYKVVNYIRSLGDKEEETNVEFPTIIDIEDSVTTNETNKEDKYVYDFYYAEGKDDLLLDQLVSIYPFDGELVCESEEENNICESEDSNSESNWRDYPDTEDSANSIDEDDMERAVARLRLKDEDSDLSSEDELVYGLDEDDVNNYGYQYAKYKMRMKKEEEEENSRSEESDSENDDYDDILL